MSVYISGPMSGYPGHNIQAFLDAEVQLKKLYPRMVILNPARNPAGLTYKENMKLDMVMVEIASVIITLPGHAESPGACAEVAYAKALRKRIVTLNHALKKGIPPGGE